MSLPQPQHQQSAPVLHGPSSSSATKTRPDQTREAPPAIGGGGMRANFRSISDGILFQSIKLKEETEVQDHSFHWDGIQMDGWMDCREEEASLGYDGSDGCCGVDIRDSRGSSSISTASPASPTTPWRKTCLRTSRFDCRHTPWGTDEQWN